jgi:hypothetical protein
MQHHNHSCNRCTTPLGGIVTLHSRERVCGACIEETGGLLHVAADAAHADDLAAAAEHGAV